MALANIYVKEFLRWTYWGLMPTIVGFIPRAITYRTMNIIGSFGAKISASKKADISNWIKDITKCSQTEAESAAVSTFINYYKNLLDSLLYNKLTKDNINCFTKYEGLEHLDAALEEGSGAILLYPHFGNEEFLMPAIGHKGYRANQVASRWEPEIRTGAKHWFVNKVRRYAFKKRIGARERLPVEFIYIDRSVRDSFRKLKNNEIILLAIDGREGKNWLEVDYLRKKALISSGPMKLAMSTGAPVLPCLTFRSGLYQHTLRVLPKLNLQNTQDMNSDLYNNTLSALEALEPHMMQNIDQYAKFKLLDLDLFKENYK